MAAPRKLNQLGHFTPNHSSNGPNAEGLIRFQVELEFVQCLANPSYLNFLAQRGFFKEQSFINYLKYLLYWKKQEYSRFLVYPQCLHFLELLQYENFRKELVNSQCAKFIEEQQLLQWQYYHRKRAKTIEEYMQGLPHDKKNENAPANKSLK